MNASTFDVVVSYAYATYAWARPLLVDVSIVVAIASLVDMKLPQPAPASNWLPVRKAVSFLALNFGNAANGSQPPIRTWLLRALVTALRTTPQGSAIATAGLAAEDILQMVTTANAASPSAPAPAAAPTSH